MPGDDNGPAATGRRLRLAALEHTAAATFAEIAAFCCDRDTVRAMVAGDVEARDGLLSLFRSLRPLHAQLDELAGIEGTSPATSWPLGRALDTFEQAATVLERALAAPEIAADEIRLVAELIDEGNRKLASRDARGGEAAGDPPPVVRVHPETMRRFAMVQAALTDADRATLAAIDVAFAAGDVRLLYERAKLGVLATLEARANLAMLNTWAEAISEAMLEEGITVEQGLAVTAKAWARVLERVPHVAAGERALIETEAEQLLDEERR